MIAVFFRKLKVCCGSKRNIQYKKIDIYAKLIIVFTPNYEFSLILKSYLEVYTTFKLRKGY